MKNKLVVSLLSIAVVVLAAALISTHQQLSTLEQQLTEAQPVPEVKAEARPDEPAEQAVETEKTAAAALVEATSEAIPEPAVEPEAEEESGSRRMMKNIAKMMDNPAMNKMMEASQRGALGAMYEDLIRSFDLSRDEEDYFMDLLMFRQMTQMDAGMKMMGGNLSDEEGAALQEQIKDANKLVKKEMKDFLNSDEDYENFEFFEKTMQERIVLSQAEASLAGTDHALTDDTYHDLVQMMYEEKNNFEFSSDRLDQNNINMSPERFSKDNLQGFANDLDRLNETLFAKAENMLSAEQFSAFKEAVVMTTDMQKAQLEMAGQMFGGGK